MNQKHNLNEKKIALILGDMLFPNHDSLPIDKNTTFFMAESFDLTSHFKYHKQKILFFLSAMRSHKEQIEFQFPENKITYHKISNSLSQAKQKKNQIISLLEEEIKSKKVTQLITYEIEDHFFAKEIEKLTKKTKITLTIIQSPKFIVTIPEFVEYRNKYSRLLMQDFYVMQRKKRQILMDGNKPLGSKWSFDHENRKKLPKEIYIPKLQDSKHTNHTKELIPLIDKLFKSHPGSLKEFNWATTRKDALKVLNHFLKEKFRQFGPYEDAINSKRAFLFHSTLSPYLNCGLLTPSEVINKSIDYAQKYKIPINSLEGFVRQILGWREFIRGLYHTQDFEKNHFKNTRTLSKHWYDATTGIDPLDDSIEKAQKFAYTHHIERLMIIGNIMLLCEVDPKESYKWFMEMYIDSADWVMVPNVYGMSQFADGGSFATKPYICGSSYIKKMSDYKKGEWAEILDALYWNFINNNKSTFQKNPRMAMMVSVLNKMEIEKKKQHIKIAKEFINKVTI